MKKLCVTAFLLLTGYLTTQEAGTEWIYHRSIDQTKLPQSADFTIAFNKVISYEGYYANHPDDKGGETYAGITRRWNSDWLGWKWIDKYKPLRACDTVKDDIVYHYVLDYYLTIWVREGFYTIIDQDVANYLYDFRINGTVGALIITRVMKDFDVNIDETNQLTPEILTQVNQLNKNKFLREVRKARVKFYKNIAKKDPTQEKFLFHWLIRANDLKKEITKLHIQ